MILISWALFDFWAFLLNEFCYFVNTFITNILNQNNGQVFSTLDINETAYVLSFILDELSY
jgi:hypothetical protein